MTVSWILHSTIPIIGRSGALGRLPARETQEDGGDPEIHLNIGPLEHTHFSAGCALGFPLGTRPENMGLFIGTGAQSQVLAHALPGAPKDVQHRGGRRYQAPTWAAKTLRFFTMFKGGSPILRKVRGAVGETRTLTGCYPTATSTLRVYHSATTARDQVVRGRIALGAVNVKGQKPWHVQFST